MTYICGHGEDEHEDEVGKCQHVDVEKYWSGVHGKYVRRVDRCRCVMFEEDEDGGEEPTP